MRPTWRTAGLTWGASWSQILLLLAACSRPELPLALTEAWPADSRACPRVDPEVLARQWMPVLAMRLALEGQIFRMGNNLQVVRVPAGVDATAMMQLPILWDRAAEKLPAEPVGVAVLCLGHAAVRGTGPSELPAVSQLRVGSVPGSCGRASAPAPNDGASGAARSRPGARSGSPQSCQCPPAPRVASMEESRTRAGHSGRSVHT